MVALERYPRCGRFANSFAIAEWCFDLCKGNRIGTVFGIHTSALSLHNAFYNAWGVLFVFASHLDVQEASEREVLN